VLPFNPHITVSQRTDYFSIDAGSEKISQGEVRPRVSPFVVAGSLKRGQHGSARSSIPSNHLTFLVSQISCVGDQQRAVRGERLRLQVFLVDKIEKKTALEQSVIQPVKIIGGLCARGARPTSGRGAGFVERISRSARDVSGGVLPQRYLMVGTTALPSAAGCRCQEAANGAGRQTCFGGGSRVKPRRSAVLYAVHKSSRLSGSSARRTVARPPRPSAGTLYPVGMFYVHMT